MSDIGKAFFAFSGLLALAASIATAPAFADGECPQWDASGTWEAVQTNATNAWFTLEQTGSVLKGSGGYGWVHKDKCILVSCGDDVYIAHASVDGTVKGNVLELTAYWDNGTVGSYSGTIGPQGRVEGNTYDRQHPDSTARWYSSRTLNCVIATPVAAPIPDVPVKSLGRVKYTGPPLPSRTICESAASARAANNAAASGLEKQCAAQLAAQPATQPPKPVVPALDEAWRKEKAARGEELAGQDALATEMRNMQSEGARRNAFDYGMAVAEGQTANGPGKQAISNILFNDPLDGYAYQYAVQFSVDRNANADLAARGAAIVAADPNAASTRDTAANPLAMIKGGDPEQAVFYKLGFNIATGIFGDPALGAYGNTAMGPGSMKIRNALSPGNIQSGFDHAVIYHLHQNYRH